MKKFIYILIIVLTISLVTIVSVNIYLGWDFYKQSVNNFFVSVGLAEKKVSYFDFNEVTTDKYKTYSTDFYTFYYPDEYLLSVFPDFLTFTKDLEKIAELKVINLKAQNFEDFNRTGGNYFFTQNQDLSDLKNLPEFYNSFLVNPDPKIVKAESEFFIARDTLEDSNELVFTKFKVNTYQVENNFKIIGLNETDNVLNNIVVYANNDLIVVANLQMPTIQEYEYFTTLITLINLGIQK
jgi:hypothetical protein